MGLLIRFRESHKKEMGKKGNSRVERRGLRPTGELFLKGGSFTLFKESTGIII